MDFPAERRKETSVNEREEEMKVEGEEPRKAAVGEREKSAGHDLRGGNRSGAAVTDSRPQLTIFYNGRVCVFDSIPPEKAHAIMLIAAATAAATGAAARAVPKVPVEDASPAAVCSPGSPLLTRTPSVLSSSATPLAAAPALPQPQPQPQQQRQPQLTLNVANSFCKLQAELPIARRHSLQRFLEKRRDRLVNNNPYAMSKEDYASGLGSEPSTPVSHFDEATKSN